MLGGRLGDLPGSRKMDESVAFIGARAQKKAGAPSLLPERCGTNFIDRDRHARPGLAHPEWEVGSTWSCKTNPGFREARQIAGRPSGRSRQAAQGRHDSLAAPAWHLCVGSIGRSRAEAVFPSLG